MGRTLARDWIGYGKLDFLEKMPGTWGGAVVEDLGQYASIRNPEHYSYFQFEVFFDEEGDMSAKMLVLRGLKELDGLTVFFQRFDAVHSFGPPGTQISSDVRKAGEVLARKYEIRELKRPDS